jgi:signal peptidase I
MNGKIYGIVICCLIIYIYMIQFHRGTYMEVFNDDLMKSGIVKTGDIICFKAYDNFNSIALASYFGHIGIVYVDPDDEDKVPYLFEANGIENMPLKSHHPNTGMFLTPLQGRIEKYKGRCFHKPLNRALDIDVVKEFKGFIDYCLETMSYDTEVFRSSFKKWFGIEKCGHKTNCAELIFLSLIKLGLIPYKWYDQNTLHYLKWMTNIKKLNCDYEYGDLTLIIDHPFAS